MRRCVLVVDDDPLIRKAGARALEVADFDVAVAGAAGEALAAIGVRAFDTAILDYYLGPGVCGCDLIAPLRARSPRVRVVVLSGLGMLPDLVRHAHHAGADQVACKAHVDWRALASGPAAVAPDPTTSSTELGAFKRAVIHGTYLVHRRNVTSAARALGVTRTSLQRLLRKIPPSERPPADDE
jgi:ActR/RegA family two-component response regulator